MSKIGNNVLVDLRKVGIAGKELVKKYFFDVLDYIEGRSDKVVLVMSITFIVNKISDSDNSKRYLSFLL